MIEIKDLLVKFNEILLPEELKRESVRKTISEIIRTPLHPKDIKIKNGTVYLNIKPIFKSEILLKRSLILAKLEESFGAKGPKDLR